MLLCHDDENCINNFLLQILTFHGNSSIGFATIKDIDILPRSSCNKMFQVAADCVSVTMTIIQLITLLSICCPIIKSIISDAQYCNVVTVLQNQCYINVDGDTL